jgi:hypothetical protein
MNSDGQALSRATTLLLAGLMLLSTLLFVAGIALERSSSGSSDTHTSVSQLAPTVAVGAAAPEGSAAREAQEGQPAAAPAAPGSAEGTAAHEAGEQNQVFGIDVESPWVIASVVLLTVLLIAALFLFGYRVLPLVFIVALVATIFDVREVVYQLGQARYAIAFLAIGVALSRLATVVVSGRAWRAGRRPFSPVAVR